jgi:pimeloyl-ACP methyl ester carboxylesterase
MDNVLPQWFRDCIDTPAERDCVNVEGAQIEWLAWGPRGAPGLLLLPGNSSHAGWWSFIAPLLADRFRVATLSWSGMGGSDWRPRYAMKLFAREALAVAEASGVTASTAGITIVGHSFGGMPASLAAEIAGDRVKQLVIADAKLQLTKRWGPSVDPEIPAIVYPTRDAAIARFRLVPQQETENDFIVTWLANGAVTNSADGIGFTWRFDPNIRQKTEVGDLSRLLERANCPIVLVRGSRSAVVTDAVWTEFRVNRPNGTKFLEIAGAGHHIMVDQPMAVATTLRSLMTAT